MLFRSIVDRGVGRRRQNALPTDPWPRYPLTSLLGGYQCVRHDEHISYGNLGDSVPPFGLAFSSAGEPHSVLAVANEEGIVRIYNTERRENALLKEWLAHENAVFDIAWVPGEPQLVTAAGDQMARLWDVKSGEMLGSFKGHLCSLKSAAFTPHQKAVFCTGARDGNIMVWDTRCSKKDGFYRHVKQISGAHNKSETNASAKIKKRRSSTRGMAPSVDTQQSVTVVLFQDQNTLISSGAVDGVIKMWDLRKNYNAHRQDPVPLQTYPYPGSCMRMRLGYSGLVLDSSRSNVFCNCTDDSIYVFNVSGVKTTPVAVFSGHQNSSFYIKSTISPDDQFLASGSSDNQTYIWKISDPKLPPTLLQGHSEEVTSVVWCPTDFTKIASCSDDHTVRVWRLRRQTDEAQCSVGQANLVGWARPKTPLSPGARAETTPAKRTGSLGGLVSPRLAACAPSGAALPLPSSTTSPVPSQDAKAAAISQKTPSSIKQWLSPSPRSPAQVGLPSRRVLSPRPQGSPSSTPPAERRAKRRLETGGGGGGASPSCEGEEDCDCVTELYPAAKRSRTLSGICRPVQESRAHTDCHAEDDTQASSRQTGKENCSPRGMNWLSAMSQKMRKGQGSPRSPRSPSSSKRQEGKAPVSPTIRSPQTMKKISTYFTRRPLE